MKEEFWDRFTEFYLEPSGQRRGRRRGYPVCSGILYLGDTPEENDRLLTLIMEEKRTAGISTMANRERLGLPLPAAGDLWIGMDSGEVPRCVVRIDHCRILPFRNVDWELAGQEGQDHALPAWQSRWREKLFAECRRSGQSFSMDELMVAECFHLIYAEQDEDF